MDRPQAIALGMVLVAVSIGIGLARVDAAGTGQAAALQPIVTAPELSDVGSGEITVYVSGPVASPGVLRLPSGAIIADAIAAAGGALPGAQLEAINLAQTLTDGEQVVVPGPETVESGSSGGDGRIPINRATASELEALPGVGPVLAERIVAHREANGPFQTPEDLLDVPGIGEAKLEAIRDLIRVP